MPIKSQLFSEGLKFTALSAGTHQFPTPNTAAHTAHTNPIGLSDGSSQGGASGQSGTARKPVLGIGSGAADVVMSYESIPTR